MNKIILLTITLFLLTIVVTGAQAQELTVKDGLLTNQLATGTTIDANIIANREMQEMNQSFNMQYLMLQQKMQQDMQHLNVTSNMMVEKHQQAEDALKGIG